MTLIDTFYKEIFSVFYKHDLQNASKSESAYLLNVYVFSKHSWRYNYPSLMINSIMLVDFTTLCLWNMGSLTILFLQYSTHVQFGAAAKISALCLVWFVVVFILYYI